MGFMDELKRLARPYEDEDEDDFDDFDQVNTRAQTEAPARRERRSAPS